MYKHLLILSDGREIFSGSHLDPVLQSVTLTQSVNNGQELTLGSACSCMLEARVLSRSGNSPFVPDEPVRLYRVEQDETRHFGEVGHVMFIKTVCSVFIVLLLRLWEWRIMIMQKWLL